jgi:protein-S-isoprenylcysteine O-methyltransferase Ste14
MNASGWSFLVGSLLFVCLASFSWGMARFFAQPSGLAKGAQFTKMCGIAFAILHFCAIFLSPGLVRARAVPGSLLYMGALGLFWWAIRTNSARPLSAIYSPDVPTFLMQDGPYRYVRHPFYASYLATWLAGFIATGGLWLLPTVAVMFILYSHAAQVEEAKFEASPLVSEYRAYRLRAGMFFPRLIPATFKPAVPEVSE